ncbi:MAG: proline--tRNA ligase [Candidatus Aminicenantia bacterium]
MEEERFVKEVIPKSEDLSRWYTYVIRRAELVDYAPMKGMMVIRPFGYAIWERIQALLDKRLKESGHTNAYFPLFIPESFLKKEAEHVEGFAPEVAWVTHGGKEELEERLAVRPTSESIICAMYSKWVRSWRDLPILINQWANVVRWEKETRPFLRTTEFLWQEGHTAHATYEEAEEEALKIISIYKEFIENELSIYVIAGRKSDSERFAGAIRTYTVEALMPDGKALQAGTSHNLGQNFSKAFDIKFESREQKIEYVWQTSWGVSTRLIGALIMSHGDDSGLIFPPAVSPYQVVIIPISKGDWTKGILPFSEEIYATLKSEGIKVFEDKRNEFTPGWKFSEWELRGVPLRIEIGPRDVEREEITVSRRDSRERIIIKKENAVGKIKELLSHIQKELFEKSKRFTLQNTFEANNYENFKRIIEERKGFVLSPWCGSSQCERRIKEDTSATIRVIPLDSSPDEKLQCIVCGGKPSTIVCFAKAY